jgi:hypothetical protein
MLQTTVFAYLDPGSASYIIQVIAGVVLAGGASLGIFKNKIKEFFSKGKKKHE